MNADNVKSIRSRSGLNQAAFAKLLGVSARAVEGWETGATITPAMALLLSAVEAALIGGIALTKWTTRIRAAAKEAKA